MFKLPYNCTHFTCYKVMHKILQASLPQYVNWDLSGIQAGFSKGRGSKNQIANACWIIEKARELKKKKTQTSICTLLTTLKPLWGSHKLWKILKEMGILDHLTCLLRNLYAGQEATVKLDMEQRTGSKLGKEYVKAVYCHPACLTSLQSTSC